jgi:small subunit ribosomal protein S16
MVRIRLTRLGAKKRPFYRVVASDSRAPRDGRFIEQLGYYDPMRDPKVISLKLDRVDHWLSVGASASETVTALIAKARAADGAAEAAPAEDAS